ncbi:MAG: hypothetical protein DGJ47_000784 [Rickettsiaceae bacterium]
MEPGLYIVSTPIGNLEDITMRSLKTLQKVDLILCEDTRVTNKLLTKYDIKAPLKPYNDNSDEKLREFIKQQIIAGKAIALVSDAGTPLISDPGYKLVRDLKKEELHVDVIPGPCAAIAALTMSGLATDKFYFHGFLPKTAKAKEQIFKSLEKMQATIIFYESPARIVDSLQAALVSLGDRKANIAREITKLYQESRTHNISELIEYYKQKPPRGEIVFSLEGYVSNLTLTDLKPEIMQMFRQGLTARTITDELFAKHQEHFTRSKIYKLVNEVGKE